MSRNSKIISAIMVCIVLGVYLYGIMEGTGPLDIARAERLLKTMLRSEVNRIDAIAPDGELAQAPPSAIHDIEAVACPKLNSSPGTLPGRYGQGDRTYGAATFECLFTGKSPSGALLYFSTYVYRSADPSVQGYTDGHIFSPLTSDRTRALMRTLGRETRVHSAQEQADLWAGLARDDIYVPADKTQKSLIERAMEKHIEKLNSR